MKYRSVGTYQYRTTVHLYLYLYLDLYLHVLCKFVAPTVAPLRKKEVNKCSFLLDLPPWPTPKTGFSPLWQPHSGMQRYDRMAEHHNAMAA